MATAIDIDGLFQLPLGEFTAARNAMAAALKAAGRIATSALVKSLARPPLSAWTVNQLHWRHRRAFDRLIAAGERLRNAQASQLRKGGGGKGELRASIEAHRAALGEITGRAADLLRDAGHAPTPDMTRRIMTTLEALATYDSESRAPVAGRLTADLDPPSGFDALAALVTRQGGRALGAGPSRVIPFRQRTDPSHPKERDAPKKLDAAGKRRQRENARKAQRAAATAALRDAERALRDARKAAAQAESALREAAARTRAAEKEKAALEQRLEKAVAEAEAARQDARRVASAAEEAAQAVTDGERTLNLLKVEKWKSGKVEK